MLSSGPWRSSLPRLDEVSSRSDSSELVARGEQLNDDKKTAEWEGYETVEERPAEGDTADGCGAHAAKEDELPLVVQRRLAHELVKLQRRVLD